MDDPRFTKAFKAFGAGAASLAFYFMGVIPAAGNFGDVTTLQWLGGVVALCGAYGITYRISNPKVPE